jgi:hypothetical protein
MKPKGAIVLVVLLLLAAGAGATVVNSLHDMTWQDGVNVSSAQVCEFCHHPHRGQAVNQDGAQLTTYLLWNINDFDRANYDVYTSSTMQPETNPQVVNATDAYALYSYLCMSCHDGTISSVAKLPRTGPSTWSEAFAPSLGDTLEDDHPVNFTYPWTDPNIQLEGGDGDIDGAVTGVEYPLFGGEMHCSTCHDVHNGSSPQVQFMRGGSTDVITDSKICQDCHLNK